MATPTAIASGASAGSFQNALGNLLSNGSITFDLSQAAAVSGGGEVVPRRVTVKLDANAKPLSGQSIYRNTDLAPSGTTYLMQLFDAGGNFAGNFGAQSLQGGPPIDLTVLTPVSSSGGTVSFPAPVLLSPTGNQAINQPAATTLSLNNFNNRIYVDGTHYALTAAGIQSAINDAITNKTYEVWLPPNQININTTLTVTDNVALIGAGPGEFNSAGNQASTGLIWTGAAGSDLLQYTGTSGTHLSNIHLSNMYLSGGRYALRMVYCDIVTLTNVAIVAGTTANAYFGICTGGLLLNCQFVQIQSGATGIVLDNTNTFFMKSIALESLAGVASPGVFIWVGGGQTHSNNFEDIQMDTFSATPVGWVKLTGYDGASPWAGAPATTAGAARNTQFHNCGFAYAVAGQSAASQGGDILIDGTATNPVKGVNFFGGNFDAQTITGGAAVAVKIDHAGNINSYGVTSRNHITGAASTFTTTANSSNVNIYDTSSGTAGSTPDTQVFSGTAAAIGLIKAIDGNMAFNGLLPFAGNPASIVLGQNGAIGVNGITLMQANSTSGAIFNRNIQCNANSIISQYQGINTVSNGVPAEYATVDLTTQSAAITTTTLYAVPAAGAGQYRLSWDAKKTTVDGVSSTLGALTIVYTDPDSTVVTLTAAALISAGTVATTNATDSITSTGALIGIPIPLNCKASTNITYAMAYASNTPGNMKYNLHIKLEAL